MNNLELTRRDELENLTAIYYMENTLNDLEYKINRLGIAPPAPAKPKQPHSDLDYTEPPKPSTPKWGTYPTYTLDPNSVTIPITQAIGPISWMLTAVSAIIWFVTLFIRVDETAWVGLFLLAVMFCLPWLLIMFFKIRKYRLTGGRGKPKWKEKYSKENARYIADRESSSEHAEACKEVDLRNDRLRADYEQRYHGWEIMCNNEMEASKARKGAEYKAYNAAMDQYLADLEHYQRVTLADQQRELDAAEAAYAETSEALDELYNKNILPAQYRNEAAVLYLVTFMGTSNYDLKYAIERFDSYAAMRQRDRGISLLEAQTDIVNQYCRSNNTYMKWITKQLDDITHNMCTGSDQTNAVLNSVNAWQKASVALQAYWRIRDKHAAKKAQK